MTYPDEQAKWTAYRLLLDAQALPARRAVPPIMAAAEDIARYMHSEGLSRGKPLPHPDRLALILDLSRQTTTGALFALRSTGFVVCRGYAWFARGALPFLRTYGERDHFPRSYDILAYRKSLLIGGLEAALTCPNVDAEAIQELRRTMPLPESRCVGTLRRCWIEADLSFDATVITLAKPSILTMQMLELLKVHFRHPAIQLIRRHVLGSPAWRDYLTQHRNRIVNALIHREIKTAIQVVSVYASAFDEPFFQVVGNEATK